MIEHDPLVKLLNMAERYAKSILVGSNADLTPIFDLRDADDESYVVETPFSGKDFEEVERCKNHAADAVRDLIHKHGIVRYGFLSEGWMIVRQKYIPGLSQQPSEADDRIEVVIAIATDGVNTKQRRWRIKRDGAKCISLALDHTSDERATFGGRFGSLLIAPQ